MISWKTPFGGQAAFFCHGRARCAHCTPLRGGEAEMSQRETVPPAIPPVRLHIARCLWAGYPRRNPSAELGSFTQASHSKLQSCKPAGQRHRAMQQLV